MSEFQCQWCGQRFEQKRSDQLFCSQVCKQKHWRWRHRLDLLRSQAMTAIDEMYGYCAQPRTAEAALDYLYEAAERLWLYGIRPNQEKSQAVIMDLGNTEELGG